MFKVSIKNILVLFLILLFLIGTVVRSEISTIHDGALNTTMGFKSIMLASALSPEDTSHRQYHSLLIKPPSSRTVEPNTFPSFSFVVFNDSRIDLPLDFEVITPRSWEVITLRKPSFVEAQSNVKIRITLAVPKNALADRPYYLGLITRWQNLADTSIAKINVDRRHSVRLLSFIEDQFVTPGSVESQTYIFKNDGNVVDTVYLNAQLPSEWELIDLDRQVILWPQESGMVHLLYRVPDTSPAKSSILIHLRASLKKEKMDEHVFQWGDSLTFTPKEREILDLLFRTSQKMGYETRALITVSETTMARQEKNALTAVTRATVLPARKKISKSLSPIFPISIGLVANRFEKGRYPNMSLYIRTGKVDMGKYTAQIEWTQRSDAAPVGKEINHLTDYYKVQLHGEKWSVSSGDVILKENPLLSYRSSLVSNDLQPMGDISRGFQLKYRFSENTKFQFFSGGRIFSEDKFARAELEFRLSDYLKGSTAYMHRDSSQIITMGTDYQASSRFSIGMLGGFTLPERSAVPFGSAIQVRSALKTKTTQILGCVHWAEPYFDGVDRGKIGAIVSTQFVPLSSLYCWGSYHIYKRTWLTSGSDSSANVSEFKTRNMVKLGKWMVVHGGYQQVDMKFINGRRIILDKTDIQLQQYLKIGLPTLGLRIADAYSPVYDLLRTQTEYNVSWLSYFRKLRLRFERKWIRTDEGPMGRIDGIDVDFGIRSLSLGFFIKQGRAWINDWENNYIERKVNSFGIRSQFAIHPFGKNYQVLLELGKYNSEYDDYESDWRIWLSFSANTIPRFEIPLPFMKTKGRVHGEIFIDRNMNGIRDSDETGVPQVLLFMESEGAMTGKDGKFEFGAMKIGEYAFHVDQMTLPAYLNLMREIPPTITLNQGSVIFLRIPVTSICSFTGNVYLDENRNARQDDEENTMPRIKLLIQNDQNQRWELYTDNAGNFKLTDLLPGFYSIEIDPEWLPERIIPKSKVFHVVLNANEPQVTLNLAVIRKELRIKKTFIAPRK